MGVFNGVLVYDVVGEMDDGNAVIGAKALPDALGCRTSDVDAVAICHRAGGVQHQRHVEGPIASQLRSLECDPGQPLAVVQRVGE